MKVGAETGAKPCGIIVSKMPSGRKTGKINPEGKPVRVWTKGQQELREVAQKALSSGKTIEERRKEVGPEALKIYQLTHHELVEDVVKFKPIIDLLNGGELELRDLVEQLFENEKVKPLTKELAENLILKRLKKKSLNFTYPKIDKQTEKEIEEKFVVSSNKDGKSFTIKNKAGEAVGIGTNAVRSYYINVLQNSKLLPKGLEAKEVSLEKLNQNFSTRAPRQLEMLEKLFLDGENNYKNLAEEIAKTTLELYGGKLEFNHLETVYTVKLLKDGKIVITNEQNKPIKSSDELMRAFLTTLLQRNAHSVHNSGTQGYPCLYQELCKPEVLNENKELNFGLKRKMESFAEHFTPDKLQIIYRLVPLEENAVVIGSFEKLVWEALFGRLNNSSITHESLQNAIQLLNGKGLTRQLLFGGKEIVPPKTVHSRQRKVEDENSKVPRITIPIHAGKSGNGEEEDNNTPSPNLEGADGSSTVLKLTLEQPKLSTNKSAGGSSSNIGNLSKPPTDELGVEQKQNNPSPQPLAVQPEPQPENPLSLPVEPILSKGDQNIVNGLLSKIQKQTPQRILNKLDSVFSAVVSPPNPSEIRELAKYLESGKIKELPTGAKNLVSLILKEWTGQSLEDSSIGEIFRALIKKKFPKDEEEQITAKLNQFAVKQESKIINKFSNLALPIQEAIKQILESDTNELMVLEKYPDLIKANFEELLGYEEYVEWKDTGFEAELRKQNIPQTILNFGELRELQAKVKEYKNQQPYLKRAFNELSRISSLTELSANQKQSILEVINSPKAIDYSQPITPATKEKKPPSKKTTLTDPKFPQKFWKDLAELFKPIEVLANKKLPQILREFPRETRIKIIQENKKAKQDLPAFVKSIQSRNYPDLHYFNTVRQEIAELDLLIEKAQNRTPEQLAINFIKFLNPTRSFYPWLPSEPNSQKEFVRLLILNEGHIVNDTLWNNHIQKERSQIGKYSLNNAQIKILNNLEEIHAVLQNHLANNKEQISPEQEKIDKQKKIAGQTFWANSIETGRSYEIPCNYTALKKYLTKRFFNEIDGTEIFISWCISQKMSKVHRMNGILDLMTKFGYEF